MQMQLKSNPQRIKIQRYNYQGYSLSIQEMLMAYVEQNLNDSLHKKIEHQVELILSLIHI